MTKEKQIMSEPQGRGAAWTDERGTSEEGRRHLVAPRRRAADTAGGRLFDKVWQRHLVTSPDGEPPLLYIDLHLVHEVTSPQAFEGLELAGRAVRRPDLTVATMDHDVPTIGLDKPIARSEER